MELNTKQLELCLQHALEQFLVDYDGSAQEAWQRLGNLNKQAPEACYFDEDAGVRMAETYERYSIADIVSMIDAAFIADRQLVEDAYTLATPETGVITIDVEGGLVMDVFGLPDGWSYEVNDLDILD